jgi:hypothetical protein
MILEACLTRKEMAIEEDPGYETITHTVQGTRLPSEELEELMCGQGETREMFSAEPERLEYLEAAPASQQSHVSNSTSSQPFSCNQANRSTVIVDSSRRQGQSSKKRRKDPERQGPPSKRPKRSMRDTGYDHNDRRAQKDDIMVYTSESRDSQITKTVRTSANSIRPRGDKDLDAAGADLLLRRLTVEIMEYKGSAKWTLAVHKGSNFNVL